MMDPMAAQKKRILVVFGTLGAMFLSGALPRGARGVVRLGVLLALLWTAAAVAGPRITRALRRST